MTLETAAISRRRWLLGSLAIAALGASRPDDHPELDKIRARGREAGMEGFDDSESEHFLAIGDAPTKFREEALTICEAVLADYLKYFRQKGFELTKPKEKLVVVTLQGPKAYAMFEGGFIDEAVGGHYDLDENRLVMFNFRGTGANPKAPVAEVDNTLALVHELTHQLVYNTSVLQRQVGAPTLVDEGLATFGETWAPKKRGVIGATNRRRLLGLELAREEGVEWIPLATLLTNDKLFSEKKTTQIAYAESWIFVSKMMKEPARLRKFRDYLAALREKSDPSKRIEIATTHLGDLTKLDKEMRSAR
jgi:hypothetical protein